MDVFHHINIRARCPWIGHYRNLPTAAHNTAESAGGFWFPFLHRKISRVQWKVCRPSVERKLKRSDAVRIPDSRRVSSLHDGGGLIPFSPCPNFKSRPL